MAQKQGQKTPQGGTMVAPSIAAQLKALQDSKVNSAPKRVQRSDTERIAALTAEIQRIQSGESRRRGRQPKYPPHIYNVVQNLPNQFLTIDYKDRAEKAELRLKRNRRLEALQSDFETLADSMPSPDSKEFGELVTIAAEISALNRAESA